MRRSVDPSTIGGHGRPALAASRPRAPASAGDDPTDDGAAGSDAPFDSAEATCSSPIGAANGRSPSSIAASMDRRRCGSSMAAAASSRRWSRSCASCPSASVRRPSSSTARSSWSMGVAVATMRPCGRGSPASPVPPSRTSCSTCSTSMAGRCSTSRCRVGAEMLGCRVLSPGDEVVAVPAIRGEGRALYEAILGQGIAGVMAREARSPYLPGGAAATLWPVGSCAGPPGPAGSAGARQGPAQSRCRSRGAEASAFGRAGAHRRPIGAGDRAHSASRRSTIRRVADRDRGTASHRMAA